MKTVSQAIQDEIYYPIGIGILENKLLKRELDGEADITPEIMRSDAYKGCLADCMFSLIQAVSYSEADKSVNTMTDKQREQLLLYVNRLYGEIGEEPVQLGPEPKVIFDF